MDGNGKVRGLSLAGLLAAVCWTLAVIAGVIRWTAGDAGLMEREMRLRAPAAETGLPEAEYAGVARMTTDYLTGRTDRFQYAFTDGQGMERLCFQPHEQSHMADCRALIRLDGIVFAACAAGTAALAAAGLRKGRSGRRLRAFGRGVLAGLAGTAAVAAVLGVWAVADFDGLFVTFHRVAFTNDGWLLNPRTDLLIRLMPETLFTDLGVRGVLRALPGLLAGALAGAALARNSEKKTNER